MIISRKVILGHHELKRRLNEDLKIIPLEDDQVRENGVDLSIYERLEIKPKSFALTKTKEWVEFPVDLMGFCNLRSSYARRGLFIPPTIIDCGFKGRLVIEIVNVSDKPQELKEGERFLHLVIAKVLGGIPYRGKFYGQT